MIEEFRFSIFFHSDQSCITLRRELYRMYQYIQESLDFSSNVYTCNFKYSLKMNCTQKVFQLIHTRRSAMRGFIFALPIMFQNMEYIRKKNETEKGSLIEKNSLLTNSASGEISNQVAPKYRKKILVIKEDPNIISMSLLKRKNPSTIEMSPS